MKKFIIQVVQRVVDQKREEDRRRIIERLLETPEGIDAMLEALDGDPDLLIALIEGRN
jgi:hypothetical protein